MNEKQTTVLLPEIKFKYPDSADCCKLTLEKETGFRMAMEKVPRIVSVAREIFSQVRTAIVMKMRFLDMAVFRLKPVPAPVNFATDGDFLYYDPARLLKRYRKESNIVNRDYMHVLLHCIFAGEQTFIEKSINLSLQLSRTPLGFHSFFQVKLACLIIFDTHQEAI